MQVTTQNIAKAQELQHEYLQGLVLSDKRNINTIACPCSGKIEWCRKVSFLRDGDTGICDKKCGHEFIYREQYREASGVQVDDGVIFDAETIRAVYCRRKMNGDYPFHIGELVTWGKETAPRDGHRLNIPIDSPFWDCADFLGHDAVFMVIGVEMSGDRVLVSGLDDEGKPDTLNEVEASDINSPFGYVGCFWVPTEYLESVSDWPYVDEE